jgi:hypothetical protein
MQPNPLWQEVPQHRFTLVRDGKRDMSRHRMDEKKNAGTGRNEHLLVMAGLDPAIHVLFA